MAHAWRWFRSLIFVGQMYLMMLVFGIVFTPFALASRPWAFRAVHTYCNWVRWTARWMIGLRSEVRGEVPRDEVLIAAKHQSFFDIIMIVSVVPRPKFIMKQSLRWAPILGWYAQRIGCVAVDRGQRGLAIQKMVDDVHKGREVPGQLIIYPQGTRVAPGVDKPFKIGAGVLYAQLGQDCVPAATNVGVFWPRTGIYRKPGLAVVEFLPRIPAGRPTAEFMASLRETVEEASDALMAEAGFRKEG
ncbi:MULTISPECIES: lysophospholipid acyltransferase family protein [Actibacterium]|uniref:1-acyl-sn-glycerol-3-phosphate acyltransferase n=1 Tax=Actibacterium naphthalenivorans TaxID=1614693 RepID=A0A840CEY5_9RHOB|nr:MULTISPECIES: 1-acyl-sn-glycerol-3-phosphate acyltransferase [Actibacterium]ALG91292.1 glycerol acyltransferase [Actibacterium sp. EMB200-NS6]MBB4022672.1 1-acyl-sn-glycerol-3-phosphate acyltransferase [Actibacterium naphthalenivorans]